MLGLAVVYGNLHVKWRMVYRSMHEVMIIRTGGIGLANSIPSLKGPLTGDITLPFDVTVLPDTADEYLRDS